MPLVYIWGEADRYENYRAAVERAGSTVRFGGTAEGCDALLLPGGGDLEPRRYGQVNTASRGIEPEREQAEWTLLERFAGKPVLGICRGMQVINVFYGGTLRQELAGHGAVVGADSFHSARTEGPLAEVCGQRCMVNSAHHQCVDRLGAGLRAVQWAPDGVVEAVYHTVFPVWGVQWHPERMPGEMGNALLRWFFGRCP